MLIEVTQDDIDKGKVGSCKECPVALAVNRVIAPGYCTVGTSGIWTYSNPGRIYSTPGVVVRFIKHFDRTREGKPFTFELN